MSSHWTFLTNHAHVLICLAQDPDATLHEVAEEVGITERATHRIVAELVRDGALERTRVGRRNHYQIRRGFSLRHPLEEHCSVGQLLRMVTPGRRRRTRRK